MTFPTANTFSSAAAIFRILEWAEAAEPVSTARVRRELDVSDRQARDYLSFLVGRGRLKSVRRGRVNEFHLVRRAPSASVSLQQAIGAEFAVAAIGALHGTAFHEGALEVVSRLRDSIPDVQGPRAVRLRNAFFPIRGSVPRNTEHSAHAQTILEAIMHGNQLRGTYELLATGETKSYQLRPVSLVVDPHGLHLIAKKRGGKVRMFDVEGFRTIERLRGSVATSSTDVREMYRHAFGRYTDYPPQNVRLRMIGVAARQVRRRSFHPSQEIVRDTRGEVEVHYRVGVCPEFTAWILSMAPNAVVLSPAELRGQLADRHAQTLGRAVRRGRKGEVRS